MDEKIFLSFVRSVAGAENACSVLSLVVERLAGNLEAAGDSKSARVLEGVSAVLGEVALNLKGALAKVLGEK